MLTAAVTLISLGTDTVSVRPSSSERAQGAEISFAKSFDEGSALADEMQPHNADGEKLKDAVGKAATVPDQKLEIAAALAGAQAKASTKASTKTGDGDKVQNGPVSVSTTKPPVNAKQLTPVAAGPTATTPGGVLLQGGKPTGVTSTAGHAEPPDGQPSATDSTSSSAAGDVKDLAQKVVPGATDVTETDEANEAVDVATVKPPAPDNGERPVIQSQSGLPITDKAQETVPIKKVAKDHDGPVKTEKASKTEKQAAEIVGTIGDAVAASTQNIVAVPPIAQPVDGHGTDGTTDKSPLLSLTPVTAGQSVGMTAVDVGKGSKKAGGVAKPEESSVKASVSAATDNASSKTEVDTSKGALAETKATSGDDLKAQSVTAANPAAGPAGSLAHVEMGATGAPIVGVNSAAVHVAAATPHMAETISSAAATVQAGSGAADAAGGGDAGHKTLMVTPTSLEVGVANGTHGWLKIRAEMAGGGVVNASLSTASSSGQEMLHRELPSLTAYLQSERVAVNAVVVQPAAAAGADARALAGGMNGDGRGQAQQSGGQGGENRQETASTVLQRLEKSSVYNSLSGVGGDEPLPSVPYAGGGSWLNVRA